ncbi:hypothetical protein GON03_04960 [Nocardioides sp. MAH-18]|uniref:WD40 repeat domain-containing protein n=1 Tax=Nocardioides agri TaxID=2682843 RepID=A0A6L6XN72_9ACTN|nr:MULTISPECIES: hypothetical protein [unclassified Nocardioides]MBA2953656.1 hypothetical protein [Nocardioides sp. CGMCC 1.13656]MVQ48520.1 hypothetical protein [Nocardioides sp. MAH-18]
MAHRTLRVVLIAGAVVVLVTAALVALTGIGYRHVSADQRAYEERGAWYADGTLHVGRHQLRLDGPPTNLTIAYTSEGAVVWDSGDHLDGDVQDPTLTLVSPSGETREVRVPDLTEVTGDALGTDPSLPYVAYLRRSRGTQEVVLQDLRDGSELTVGEPIPNPGGTGGSSHLALSPDLVTYPHPDHWGELRWRTGQVFPWSDLGGTSLPWSTGRTAVIVIPDDERAWRVVDRLDGEVRLTVPIDRAGYSTYASLSPDDRWFAEPRNDGLVVHDVATGETTTLDGVAGVTTLGWTPDGHLILRGQDGTVRTCDPEAGRCESTRIRTRGELVAPTGAYSEAF